MVGGDIHDYLENLGVGAGIERTTAARGASGATVLRTPEDKLLAQVEEPELADLLRRGPRMAPSRKRADEDLVGPRTS